MSFRSCMCVLISMVLSFTKSQCDGFSTGKEGKDSCRVSVATVTWLHLYQLRSAAHPPRCPTGTASLSPSDPGLPPQCCCQSRRTEYCPAWRSRGTQGQWLLSVNHRKAQDLVQQSPLSSSKWPLEVLLFYAEIISIFCFSILAVDQTGTALGTHSSLK